jgi:two-component system cell cycle response regulator DivK
MSVALVIEDNEDNQVLICALLQRGGYQTCVAPNGLLGVQMALELQPDLIILDIQLPDIDGTEVLRRIRAAGAHGRMPVIAMTSYAMTGDRARLLEAGCSGYIEKPIDTRRVLNQISAILKEPQ